MSLPAYPKYKDSGVEWLGEIPESWDVRRLNDIAKMKTSNVDKKTVAGQEDVKLCNYVDVYYNKTITSKIQFMAATASPSEVEKFKLNKGDVVFTKDSESPFDIGVPALVDADIEDLVCGYHLSIVQGLEGKLTGDFLFYALVSDPSVYQFTLAANGVTRFGLTQSGVKNIQIGLPPFSEQQAIADYLDKKTGQIDTLIEKKKELIERLKEQRTAIITHAVTQGLDDSVPMKDSGVEWLKETPKTWTFERLNDIAKMKTSNVDKKTVAGQEDVKLCNYVDVYYNETITSKIQFMAATASSSEVEKFKLNKGDVVFTKDSESPFDIGVPALVDADIEDLVCGYHLSIVQGLEDKLTGGFLFYALVSDPSVYQFTLAANGVTRFGLTQSGVKNIQIGLPPFLEQQAIADYLNEKTCQIDALVEKTKEAIQRLEEYRTAVITAAVTGKVKVG